MQIVGVCTGLNDGILQLVQHRVTNCDATVTVLRTKHSSGTQSLSIFFCAFDKGKSLEKFSRQDRTTAISLNLLKIKGNTVKYPQRVA